MDRLASVDLPAFRLQLLLRERPSWRHRPVVVVTREAPNGEVIALNERAARAGVRRGQTLAAALSATGDLRAAPQDEARLPEAVDEVLGVLRGFSHGVEACREDPGVFWMRADGLGRLYRSPAELGRRVVSALAERDLVATVVLGFDPFATRALARVCHGVVVLPGPAEEAEALRPIPLARLDLPPATLERLELLGVPTLGALLALPAGGLARRFGSEVEWLHRAARGSLARPVQPEPERPPLRASLDLEPPTADRRRLLAHAGRALPGLLARTAERGERARRLLVTLDLEGARIREHALAPAEPTLEADLLLELLGLRLEIEPPPAPVERMGLEVEGLRGERDQLLLFDTRGRRDPAEARRALARLRVELGDEAVVRAELRDAHLPEARFRLVPDVTLPEAAPERVARRPLVRRIALRPAPTSALAGEVEGGPFVVSGGWWAGRGVHRTYHLLRSERGRLVWAWYDEVRRAWFAQGTIG